MNEKQIKRTLEDRGLTIADVVRKAVEEMPGKAESTVNTGIRNAISAKQNLPVYRDFIFREFGISVDAPPNARQRMQMQTA